MCNIKFELTLTRWPIHTGYGTMRVYRVILAELPNQFEEKRNAFPIIDLAWRLSVTQHQTCLSSHIHSNVLYILFCIFISGAIVLSQVIRTIMHCNKIIPFFQWNLFLSLLWHVIRFLKHPQHRFSHRWGEIGRETQSGIVRVLEIELFFWMRKRPLREAMRNACKKKQTTSTQRSTPVDSAFYSFDRIRKICSKIKK